MTDPHEIPTWYQPGDAIDGPPQDEQSAWWEMPLVVFVLLVGGIVVLGGFVRLVRWLVTVGGG